MKTLLKTTAAAIALTAVIAGTASAAVSKTELANEVAQAMSSSSGIAITEVNGVVTLSGQFADAGDEFAAITAAKAVDGVDRVINLGWQSN